MGSRRGGFVYRARRTPRFPLKTVLVLLAAVAALVLLRQQLLERQAPARPTVATKPAPQVAKAPPGPGRRAPEKAPLPRPGASYGAAGSVGVPEAPPGPPRVALVLDDVGGNLPLALEAADRLPRSVTFAVIPHLKESGACARALHERGFPVILQVPMQPEDGGRWKPVTGELDVGMGPAEVARVLSEALADVPQAEGANNHMGSRATRDPALMDAAMAVLRSRGLYFLDSRTTPGTVAAEAARRAGVPCAQRAVFLDEADEQGAIMVQLDSAGEKALKEGAVVAIGHLRPNTVHVLSERLPHWDRRGVRFVPLREVVR